MCGLTVMLSIPRLTTSKNNNEIKQEIYKTCGYNVPWHAQERPFEKDLKSWINNISMLRISLMPREQKCLTLPYTSKASVNSLQYTSSMLIP